MTLLLGLAAIFAIENVSVIPMDRERTLDRQTVIVRDGRIAEIGATRSVKIPDGATRINGAGQFLMPGFAEMHGHLPAASASEEEIARVLFLYVANGVTTVRGMLGHPRQLEIRARIRKGELTGPNLYLAGPALSGATAPTAEIAEKMVREQKLAGYDLIKVQEGLKPEVYDSLVKTARAVSIRFGGHVPNEVGLLNALEARQSSIDHMDNYLEALEADNSAIRNADPQTRARDLPLHVDESKIPILARRTRESGAWIVPTMALWDNLQGPSQPKDFSGWSELKFVPKQWVDQWTAQKTKAAAAGNPQAGERLRDIRKKMLRALNEAGVGIMFGTDSPQVFSVPGFSIHREIPWLTASGMTPYQILRSGTRNAAAYFDATNEFGTVEVGRRADLVLLRGNPLKDLGQLRDPAGVMLNGRWISGTEIRNQLNGLSAP